MKYIKFGFCAIAAQTINAKCCCGNNSNNNNNGNNGDDKNKDEKDFADEIVEFFGVTKEKILARKDIKVTADNYATKGGFSDDELDAAKKEYQKQYDADKSAHLKLYLFTKVNLKTKSGVSVILVSKNAITVNATKLYNYVYADFQRNFNENKDINVYSSLTIDGRDLNYYTKENISSPATP